MEVLVDTSIWIDYFRGGEESAGLDFLIDENLIVVNDIILAELIPFLRLKKQDGLIGLLLEIRKVPLQIDWPEIIEFQVRCLQNGANGIGIPDLLIAQNALTCNVSIWSLDRHFKLLEQVLRIDLYA